MLTIRLLREKLYHAARLLKAASGNDVFISHTDLEKLLETLNGQMRIFINELYFFAQAQEESERGRITRADIDQAVAIIENDLLNELDVPAAALSSGESMRLLVMGEEYVSLARSWKDVALESPSLDATALLNQLKPLLKGLYFNAFYKEQANIQIYILNDPPADWNTAKGFSDALYHAGNQDLLGFNQYLENPQVVTPVDAFFVEFVAVQLLENQATAQEVVHLMQKNLVNIHYLQYNSNYYENTTYFVAGKAADGNLVFLYQSQFWN